MDFSLNEIIYELKAKVKDIGQSQRVTGVSTDTRTIKQGDLFVAILGENFDGHDYAARAISLGAVGVVVEKTASLPTDKVLHVKDTKKALLQLGGLWRRKCRAKIVAVTGSVGKTTTKEFTAKVLETQGKTLKTRENLNNEIGLSHMLFQLDDSYDFAVLELGVDGPGEMLEMTKAAGPDVAIITNIGISHIEAFKTKRRIQKEKLLISDGLGGNGTLLLNGDDPSLVGKGRGVNTIYYAMNALSAEIQGRNVVVQNEHTTFQLYYHNNSYKVSIPIAGLHNAYDALAAFGAGVVLGVTPQDAILGLESYETEGMRQRTVNAKGFTVIEDCYNASPQSMEAALETFHQLEVKGRKILLLGDMLELGVREKKAHTHIGKFAASLGFDALFATGTLSKGLAKAAEDAGMKNVYYYKDTQEVGEKLKEYLEKDDTLWAKASRGIRLENALEILYQEV